MTPFGPQRCRQDRDNAARLLLFLLVVLAEVLLPQRTAWGQELPAVGSEIDQLDEASQPPQLRRLFFPVKQAAKLVPDGFRPVEASELESRVRPRSDVVNASRHALTRATYIATLRGGLLFSGHTSFEFSSDTETRDVVRLGACNLALRPSGPASETEDSAVIATSADGTLIAMCGPEKELVFGWEKVAEESHIAGSTRFGLQLVQAPISRLLLQLPSQMTLASDEGAVTELGNVDGLTPELKAQVDAHLQTLSSLGSAPIQDWKWWSVEVGGLSQIALEVRDPTTAEGEQEFRCTSWDTDYRVSESEITFNTRLQVVADEATVPPEILIPRDVHLLSLRVNGRALDWIEQPLDADWKQLRTSGEDRIAPGNISIVVQGLTTNWLGETLSLPAIEVPEERLEFVATTRDVRVQIDSDVKLATLELPAGWRYHYSISDISAESSTPILRLLGPPAPSAPIKASFIRTQQVAHGDAVAHLRFDDQSIQCEMAIDLSITDSQHLPLKFELQNPWTITNVEAKETEGRVNEFDYRMAGQYLEIWPRDPTVDALRFVVQGESTIDGAAPTWFLRPEQARLDVYYAVTAPQDLILEFSAQDRISTAIRQLPPDLASLISSATTETRYFRVPRADALGPISLGKRRTDLTVQATTEIQAFDELLEQRIVLRVTRPTADQTALRIRIDDTAGEQIAWNALRRDVGRRAPPLPDNGAPGSGNADAEQRSDIAEEMREQSLPVRSDRVADGGQAEWEVIVPESMGIEFLLVGVRRIPMADLNQIPSASGEGFTIGLPTVLNTDHADSTIELHDELLVAPQSLDAGIEQLRSTNVADDFVLLRYQPGQHDVLHFLKRNSVPNQCTYAEYHHVSHHLSATGTEHVESKLAVEGPGAFEIHYPEELNFLSLTVNGNVLPKNVVAAEKGTIAVPDGKSHRQIGIVWQRLQQDRLLVRRWHPVEIKLGIPSFDSTTNYHLRDGWQAVWPLRFRLQLPTVSPASGAILLRPASAICFAIVSTLLFGIGGWFTARWLRLGRVGTVILVACGLALSGVVGLTFLLSGIALITGIFLRHLNFRLKALRGALESRKDRSSVYANPGLAILVACLTALSLAVTASSADGGITVLIPVDPAGEQAGNKVYISEAAFRRLFNTVQADALYADFVLRESSHSVQLDPFDPGENPQRALVRSQYSIETFDAQTDVELAIDPQLVRSVRVESGEANGESGLVRTNRLAGGIRLLGLPRGRWQVAVDTVVEVVVDEEEGEYSIQPPILPCHRATAEVTYPSNLPKAPRIVGYGREENSDTARRVSRHLGAVDTLNILWQETADEVSENVIRVSQWNRLGWRDKIEELQLIRAAPQSRKDQTMVVWIGKEQRPLLLSSDWRLVDWERIAPDTSQAVLVPIRQTTQRPTLAWRSPIDPASSRTSVSQIPVFEPLGMPLQHSYVAVSHTGFWEVDAIVGLQRVEPDEFYAAWTGVRKDVSVAFRPTGTERSIMLSRNAIRTTEIDERQEYAVGPFGDTLRYQANIYPGENDLPSLTLAVPQDLVVTKVTIDGEEVFDRVQSIPGQRVFVIDRLAPYEPLEATVEGWLRRPSKKKRQLPRVVPLTGTILQSLYTVTRDPRTRVSGLEEIDRLAEISAEPLDPDAQSQLRNHHVPVAHYRLDGSVNRRDHLPVTVTKGTAPALRDAVLVSSLVWDSESAEWYCESVITLNEHEDPQILTLDVPYEWASDPKSNARLMLLEAGEPDRNRAIRLQISAGMGAEENPVILRLRRSGPNPALLSAPQIELLGAQQTRRYFILPSELTTRPLNWNVQDMERREFDEFAPLLKNLDVRSAPSPIVVVGDQDDQVPLLNSEAGKVSLEPVTSICDVQLFENGTSTRWAVVSWDLQPGDRQAIQFHLPEQCSVACVWSAERQTVWQQESDIVNVQLNLSHLAQRVRILMRIEGRPLDWIPRLINDSPRVMTVAVLRPEDSPTVARAEFESAGWERISEAKWRALRGRAILDLLTLSSDAAASRSSPEIIGWLRPWERRFQSVLGSIPSSSAPDEEGLDASLQELKSEMETLASRFRGRTLVTETTADENLAAGWEVSRLYGNRLPTSHLAVSAPSNRNALIGMMVIGLSILGLLYVLGVRLRETRNETLTAGIMTIAVSLVALPVVPWQLFVIPLLAVFALLTINQYWAWLRFG